MAAKALSKQGYLPSLWTIASKEYLWSVCHFLNRLLEREREKTSPYVLQITNLAYHKWNKMLMEKSKYRDCEKRPTLQRVNRVLLSSPYRMWNETTIKWLENSSDENKQPSKVNPEKCNISFVWFLIVSLQLCRFALWYVYIYRIWINHMHEPAVDLIRYLF